MGASVSIRNLTPYTWHYKLGSGGGSGTLNSWGSVKKKLNFRWIRSDLKLRHDNHRWNSFSYEFNSHKQNGSQTFTIIETSGRSHIQLLCDTESNSPTCPNYGKQEEDRILQQQMEQRRQDEKQRRQQEERRRQEQLERERTIQQEIKRESELSGKKVSKGREKLRQKLSLKGQQRHHQCTQVLHQMIEDDAAAIKRDEPGDLKNKFDELLKKYEITEDKSMQGDKLENRMKNLQNELILQYFGEPQPSIWCQLTIDRAISQGEKSLTEKFSIFTAVAELTLTNDPDTDSKEDQLPDQKYDFLIRLLEQLYSTNPTVAQQLVLSILDVFTEVSEKNKGLLSQILFNMIWTPSEILLFLRGVSGINQELATSILHTVRTNKLDLLSTLSALKDKDPVNSLQRYAEAEGDKDADTIVNEMHNEKYPEKILSIMKEILGYMTEELPKHTKEDLDQVKIEEATQMIKSLDFTNPDLAVLKKVLIMMSIAVQDCSTIYTQNGKNTEGYFPRLTQLASLLMLLLPKSTGKKGILLEIGTGEGKSCILAMFATIQAIRGTKVDIVTSSPVLARRDQEEWKKLYDMFGVTSSVVPPPQIQGSSPESRDSRLQEAYRKQLVYGTVGSFAADTLRQEFEKETTRGERRFDMVIVDEVDYMTLDNGVQVTFLSHEASGLRHLEQVLASIWAMVSMCQPIEMDDTGEIECATGIQNFQKALKLAVIGPTTSTEVSEFHILGAGGELGIFSDADFDMFMHAPENTEKDNTTENRRTVDTFMAKVGITQQCDLLNIMEKALENDVAIDCCSVTNNKAVLVEEKKLHNNPDILEIKMLLPENGRASEIIPKDKFIKATVSELKSKITFSGNSQPNSEFLVIPSFLEVYLENQLPVFVENALKAIRMTQGREYMIDQTLEAVGDKNLYHAIIPVDFQASGVLEKNKRWGDGLQQFLEMKHQLATTPLSNVTNYLSNFHYFQKYLKGNGIFGVSGTLGGDADKDFLARHYETDSYTIPAHRHKKIVELPAIQVSGQAQWMEILCKTAMRVAESGQVVLVVCEDVKTANELLKKIESENPHPPITLYTISEKHNIESTKFRGGHIIIATNLGGRGTDIKVDQDVNIRGGLFVLLTHYPGSRRVEKQVFGRTGRKGNPGMVQMILCGDNLAPAYQGQPVEIMRQLREEYEVQRIKDMETDELLEIKIKEDLFGTFDGNFTKQERIDLSGMGPNDVPEYFKDKGPKFDYQPALNALKKTWALWLTLHGEHIREHEDISVLKAFKNTVTSTVKKNAELDLSLTEYISSAVPKGALQNRNNYKIDSKLEQQMKDLVQDMTKKRIPGLMTDATTSQVSDVISRLSEVCNNATDLVAKSGTHCTAKGVKISAEIDKQTKTLSIPTEHVINYIFVPKLIKEIEKQQKNLDQYDQDGRHDLPDVIRLKNEFLISISESVSEAFIDACAGLMSSFVTELFKKKVNGVTEKVVDNVHKTEGFFQDWQHKHNIKSASQKTGKALSETETKELLDYAEKIGDVNRPASALDIYVLTNSDLLHGKAVNPRNNVKDQIKGNLQDYSEMVKTQKAYDALERNHGKYAIVGGVGKSTPMTDWNYFNDISPLKEINYNYYNDSFSSLTERDIAISYKLGFADTYKSVKNNRRQLHNNVNCDLIKGAVDADHIPPKNSLKLAREQEPQMENLKDKNPKLYDMINSIESDQNGENLLTMRVLEQHHMRALTTGNSNESKRCRKLLADTLASGDVEKSLKYSFIMAHPIASDQLRDNANPQNTTGKPKNHNQNTIDMSPEGTMSYYEFGFNCMLHLLRKNEIITQNYHESLKTWLVDKGCLDKNTPEYKETLAAIKNLPSLTQRQENKGDDRGLQETAEGATPHRPNSSGEGGRF